uniref:G-protein coupled receptors family 3 profile domain-containing protein n=1 Tax=Xenopus tropicalis TaxID=8364 RepID=F6QEF6_XENTR
MRSSFSIFNVLAFVFAINEINNNPDLLPNITLGFHIVDNCLNEERAISAMLDIISGGNVPTPNYRCGLSHNLVAFVDGISTRLTLLFISFSSLDPVLSDKIQFPFFYRTVPSDDFQYLAIVTLIKYFSWTWVGILVPNDEFGLKISQLLLEELTRNYICVAFLEFLAQSKVDKEAAHKIADKIKSTNVIILYGDRDYVVILQDILYLFPVSDKVWIISSQWDVLIGNDHYFKGLDPFNGSLAFTPHKGAIPGFKEFTSSIKPDLYPNDIFILRAWFELFQCSYIGNATVYDHLCTGNEIIQYERFNEELSYNSYSIYNAVYVLAHALHHMHLEKMKSVLITYFSVKLHKYLKNINFTNSGGEKLTIDENRRIDAKFDILNWAIYSNQTLHSIKVGSYDPQNASQGLTVSENLIRWSPAFSQTPHSACSETCLAGYRKTPKAGYPACCYDCIPCPEGQITNVTDMERCITCPITQWPNAKKDTCLDKVIIYLSYEEELGIPIAFSSIFFFFLTCLVMTVFNKYRTTPIVKANNQNLSYVLLFSLKMCFLCPLIFIGQPIKLTCMTRQTVFSITFSISLSSILAKTITVVIVFHATRPGSKLKNLMGSKVSVSIVIFCSFVQVVICACWLGISPPFPQYNMEDEVGKIIAECNEGSLIGFYCVLGYLGVLASVSFIIAFLARDLPDTFNEAKFITFSMLVFCSVWVSFIPAYMSAKGKYIVAVEIFAILASSLALLGCIFIPKCYVILVKPECNTRDFTRVHQVKP